jgi:hypothetical protein
MVLRRTIMDSAVAQKSFEARMRALPKRMNPYPDARTTAYSGVFRKLLIGMSF